MFVRSQQILPKVVFLQQGLIYTVPSGALNVRLDFTTELEMCELVMSNAAVGQRLP